MRLGIDIGGTHTDGALFDNSKLIKTSKIPTDKKNLTNTILNSCQQLISEINPKKLDQIVLSTTLATNVIVEENYPTTALILIPGPGINPKWYNYSPYTKIVTGSIDHRGREVKTLNQQELNTIISELISKDITRVGICGKFSTRNSKQELEIKNLIKSKSTNINQITLGHKLSGRLNYPRRIATTYLNTIIKQTQTKFTTSIKQGLKKLKIESPIYFLKADGGTMPLDIANKIPIETINSGPAASIMGILALNKPNETTIGLDIGGTTTDISLFINQDPVFKPEGIELNNYKTLIRGLYNQSIACGGDSLITINNNQLQIGPQRKGPAAAFGGNNPTPTDALVVLDLINQGNKQAALTSLQPLAKQLKLSVSKLATKIINQFCKKIESKIQEILTKLNNQPVYTINELLTDTKIHPTKIVGIGGPAKAIIPKLANTMGLDYTVPKNSKIANAIGAALAKVTQKCTLYADTAQGYYNIPELSITEKTTPNFNLEQAKQITKQQLNNNLNRKKREIEISHAQSFNLVRGFNTVGKIIQVTAQAKPGIELVNN